MEQGFIDILKKLVAEQTSATLTDAKRCKALLADYTRNEYKKESRLLVQAVEAGVAKRIDGVEADDLAACKKVQIRELEDEYGLASAMATDIVNALALVLRGDTGLTVSPSVEKTVEKPAAKVVKPAAVVEKPSIMVAQNSTFTDPRDGQVYRTVKIGSQVWMAENLNYKTKNSWCYDNDKSNGKKYGRLYTWEDAMAACPNGWRLPSREELGDLMRIAEGVKEPKKSRSGNEYYIFNGAGKKLKSKAGWNGRKDGTTGNGTDKFRFSAMPGGYRDYNIDSFGYVGYNSDWWSATEYGASNAYYWGMNYNNDYVYENYDSRSYGLSVRCVGVVR